MTSSKRLEFTMLGDREVRPGDIVEIKTVEELALGYKQDGDQLYCAEEERKLLVRWLGDGPFTIDWIGEWPCGNVTLYLHGAKSDQSGCDASSFKPSAGA